MILLYRYILRFYILNCDALYYNETNYCNIVLKFYLIVSFIIIY